MAWEDRASLREMVAVATDAELPPAPPAWPDEGESEAIWRERVREARAEHEEPTAAAVAAAPINTELLPGVAHSREVAIPVGGASIAARVYTPEAPGPHPALVMFHGGGWWIGGGSLGLTVAEPSCQLLCARVGAVIVNVDYRLAPEHRFPVPLEDCYAATLWVERHAGQLAVDPTRLAVSGASAGGNLAAAVTLLARQRSGPGIGFQQLLVPALDGTLSSPSISEHGAGTTEITQEALVSVWDFYAGPGSERTDPLLSPLHEPDLTGLPPAQIVVGEYDPLRDDGLRYAERLAAAGVEVQLSRYEMTHGIFTPDVGEAYLEDVVAGLRRGLRVDEDARVSRST